MPLDVAATLDARLAQTIAALQALTVTSGEQTARNLAVKMLQTAQSAGTDPITSEARVRLAVEASRNLASIVSVNVMAHRLEIDSNAAAWERQWYDAALVIAVESNVQPLVECVVPGSPQNMAYFGYQNNNPVAVAIPAGNDNKIQPGTYDRGQPIFFLPGRSPVYPNAVYSKDFDGPSLTWKMYELTGVATPVIAPVPVSR